jgi:hypothetical protein
LESLIRFIVGRPSPLSRLKLKQKLKVKPPPVDLVTPPEGVIRLIKKFGRMAQTSDDARKYLRKYLDSLRAKALSTNWMSYEIDKTVSIFYFLVILILIFVSLNYQPSSSNLLKVLNILENSKPSSPNNASDSSSPISKIFMKGKSAMFVILLIPNDSSSIISQKHSSGPSPPHANNSSSKIFMEAMFVILLGVAMVSVGVITAISSWRLYQRNRLIVKYFFAQEEIIPALKARARSFKEINPANESEIAELEKITTEIPTSIGNKDWGMAEFFSSRLERLVNSLVDDLGSEGYGAPFKKNCSAT